MDFNLSNAARVWLALAAVAVAGAIGGSLAGLPGFLLTFAGATLVGAIALVWGSLTSLGADDGMTFDEALSLAAPTVEEEQKRAVLRALKDLEYELQVGKISREDYEEGAQRYRAEARRLIAASDEALDERRRLAEQRFEAFLRERRKQGGELPVSQPTKLEAEDESPSGEAETGETESATATKETPRA